MRRTGLLVIAATSLACYQGITDFGDGFAMETGLGDGDGDPGDGDGETGDGDGDPGDGDGDPGDGDGDPGDGDPGDGDPGDGDGDGDGGPGDGDGGPGDGDGDPLLGVCDRWNADRANLNEGSWSGSVNGCNAGDMDAAWRARAMTQVNLYRWLADLPPITTSADRNAKAQECALMMQANNTLSHTPPMSWTCWTADGSQGAGNSNIAGTAAVTGVDLYMVDYGNASTIGHRRWILSNSIGPTGIGSTDGYSCMWTLGGNNNLGEQWVAWPPPGEFPAEAVNPLWWGSGIDESGWSLQSDALNLSGAQVAITVNGDPRPVTITNLSPGYGSSSAITMIPNGWSTQAGSTYHVEVSNVGAPISYDVQVIDCG